MVIDRICSFISPHRLAWTTGWLRFAAGARNLVLEVRDAGADNPAPEGRGNPVIVDEFPGDESAPTITEEELISLDQRDREMLRSIVRLDFTTVREIMVPRLDMAVAEQGSTLAQVSQLMAGTGHSRLPVYEENSDRIIGIVHSRDVLGSLSSGEAVPELKELLHPVFFIPETKRLDHLLADFQNRGEQMAIVVDEYGGTEGLVTMEDLLEEIVGEIEDEFSRTRESEVDHLPDGVVLVDAGVHTNVIEELFDTTIAREGVDTVGGYVFRQLGRLPQVGDVVTTGPLEIEVVSVMGRRLRRLSISRANRETPRQDP